MKKYLIPESGNFYKANLHCHSTVSDGALSPEELKRIYMEKGYSIIAYTDHDVFLDHSDLAEEGFLPLNGYEVEINQDPSQSTLGYNKTCHICFVALKPDNLTQVLYHRTKYMFANAEKHRHLVKYDENIPDYERKYDPQCISEMMQTARDNGFFVTYNHPAWSLEDMNDYTNYHGMHAMEICNYGCVVEGYTDYNDQEYDEMLRYGERIFCIGTDDNHNRRSPSTRQFDSFGAYTVIKAEELRYEAITDALVAGHFYASQGPEIHGIWFEDGKIHVTCSPADRVLLVTGRRRAAACHAEDGNLLESASFDVLPEDGYVRLAVVDEKGYYAHSNAYFTDELFEDR